MAIFTRDLTIHTVERIDELAQPVVRALRDCFETCGANESGRGNGIELGANENSPVPGSTRFVDHAALREFADLHGVPAEVVSTIQHPISHADCEVAVFVYREVRALSRTNIMGFAGVDFRKLEDWINERHIDALRRNGIQSFVTIPANDPRFEISRRIDREYHNELASLHGLLPKPPPVVPGWEGNFPNSEIVTPADLRKYLEERLGGLRSFGLGEHEAIFKKIAFDDAVESLRNALRVFDLHGGWDRRLRPSPWPSPPRDEYEAERHLSEMIRRLGEAHRQPLSDDQPEKSVPQEKQAAVDDCAYRATDQLPGLDSLLEKIICFARNRSNQFREAIQRWTRTRILERSTYKKAGKTYVAYSEGPVCEFLKRYFTDDEKFVILAAFHDAHWQTNEKLYQFDVERAGDAGIHSVRGRVGRDARRAARGYSRR